MTPPAVAHDSYRSHEHRRSWFESYRNPRAGRYTEAERYRGYNSSRESGKNQRKYDKAMNRLEHREREARAKAYNRYEGDRRDPGYRERLGKIDRKYDDKRAKVERNWGDR